MLPVPPNKLHGVARVEDLKILNRIYWRLLTGWSGADIPEHYGPDTTCYNRFVRWRKLGVRYVRYQPNMSSYRTIPSGQPGAVDAKPPDRPP